MPCDRRSPIPSAETGPDAARPGVLDWAELRIGGRIAALSVTFVLGAIIGAVGTVGYQSAVIVFDLTIPVGLVASLLVATALLAGLRLVAGTRFVPAAASIGMLGVIAVLSQESPGGSILVPASPLSYCWVYGPVLIAFVVLAWPDLHRGQRVRITEVQNRKELPRP